MCETHIYVIVCGFSKIVLCHLNIFCIYGIENSNYHMCDRAVYVCSKSTYVCVCVRECLRIVNAYV